MAISGFRPRADPEGMREAPAPYTETRPSGALVEQPLPAQSPLYQQAQSPYGQDPAVGESWVQRLQPPVGWGEGSYALNSARDAGSPISSPDEALPGLRDGVYPFSQRLKNLGDQGVLDAVSRAGGSYFDVDPPPYLGND